MAATNLAPPLSRPHARRPFAGTAFGNKKAVPANEACAAAPTSSWQRRVNFVGAAPSPRLRRLQEPVVPGKAAPEPILQVARHRHAVIFAGVDQELGGNAQ